MSFRIRGLNPEPFRPLFALDDAALIERGMRSVTVTEPNSAPCRIALCDAEPETRVLLLHYAHQTAHTPYRSAGPIFVGQTAREAFDRVDVLPPIFVNRPLSVRAYDRHGMMINADVVQNDPRSVIDAFFSDCDVEYLHVHLARRGCFACRVDRV